MVGTVFRYGDDLADDGLVMESVGCEVVYETLG